MSKYQLGRGRTTGLMLAAVAVALSVPLTSCGTASPSAAAKTGTTSATTPSPEPTATEGTDPSEPKETASVTLDFGQLQRGTSDAVWWDAKQKAIVDGDEKFKVASMPTVLSRVTFDDGAPGYLVLRDADKDGNKRTLEVVGEKATSTIAEGYVDIGNDPSVPAVSADRKQIAWSQLKTGSENKPTFIAAANGDMISDIAPSKEYDVVGFAGDRVVLQTPASDERPVVALWDPKTRKLAPVDGVQTATVTDPSTGLLSGGTVGKGACSGVWDTAAEGGPKQLWKNCDLQVVSFSPDGKYAAARQPEAPGAGPTSVTVLDARTGVPVLKVNAGLVEHVSWDRYRSEDQARLVVSAWNSGPDEDGKVTPDDKTALVACDLAAKCELLTDPVHYDPSNLEQQPYVLGTL